MAEPPFGHEYSGIATRRILGVGAVLAICVIVTVIAVYLGVQQRLGGALVRNSARAGLVPPPPRLEPHPYIDVAALRAQKQARLGSYGWTDGARQFAHIPIEQAMAIYARQHQAAKAAPPPPAAESTP